METIGARLGKLNPPPVRDPLPILIGGGGGKGTLKLTARYADMWHGFGTPEVYKHKNEVLDNWCREVGRDPAAIERVTATYADRMGQLDAYVAARARHIILEWGAPWDLKPVRRLVEWRDAQ